MNRITLKIEKYAVKYFTLLLSKTIKYIEFNDKPDYRCIYVFWHRNLLPLMYLHRHRDIVILISPSDDGELIAGPASLFGYQTVRGSSSKNGLSSLREMIRLAGDYSLAITPDGPVGPREVIKESALYLAYRTGLPLVLVAVDMDKQWVFRTWDCLRVPKFGSTIKVSYSEPVYIREKEQLDNKRLTIQREMDKLTAVNRERHMIK